MSRLEGRCALVTGAAGDIGAATARVLARDGASVVLVDLDMERTEAIAADIRQGGSQAAADLADVRDAAQVAAVFERAEKTFGGVDILVNNAGVIRDNLVFRMDDDDWDTVIDTHLKGSFICARAAQRHMVEQRWGRIINISSTAARGNRGQVNYSSAKAGLQGMAATLAFELGPFNITSNCVAPGYIASAMTRAASDRAGMTFDDAKREASTRIPLRRVGEPSEVAEVVSFLGGDEASYVSGQVIYVNGGAR